MANPANLATQIYLLTKNGKQITWTPRRDGDLFYMFDEQISDNPNYETDEMESFGSALIVADKTSTASQITVSIEYRSVFSKMSGTPFILMISYTSSTPASIDDIAVTPATTGAVTTFVNDYTVATSAQESLSFPFDATPVPSLGTNFAYAYWDGIANNFLYQLTITQEYSGVYYIDSTDIPAGTTVTVAATLIASGNAMNVNSSCVINSAQCTRMINANYNSQFWGCYSAHFSTTFPLVINVLDNNSQGVSFSLRLVDLYLTY